MGLFGGNLLEVGQFLYRNDNFLMLLAADPARRSDMGARGRQKAEAEFDDRVVIGRTLDAYRSLPEPPTSWTTARMRS